MPAPKLEDLRDENVKLRREVEFLRGQLLTSSLNDQGTQTAAPRVQRSEDGRDITSFLSIYEIDCIRSKVPPDLRGEHVGDHLVGEALAYYLHMRRMGVDLRQWDTVRERFLRRFCRATRQSVLAQLYRNTWRGDHGLYIARFSQAVTGL